MNEHVFSRRRFLQSMPAVAVAANCQAAPAAEEKAAPLKLAVFDVDAMPPRGSALAYDRMRESGELTLRCRGLVLTGMPQPVVLCTVDWIGIANGTHDAFREALAEAAGTEPDRVAVHVLHQHDAPLSDFTAGEILRSSGQESAVFDELFTRDVIGRAAQALKAALPAAQPVTHAGMATAEVREVASNRRIFGPDGKVRAFRATATKDPALRAEPEGVIDPLVSVLGFWNGERPLAALSYYATHPQSYYRTGIANPDFPGIARFLRQQQAEVPLHLHFTGAGGNIGAGKYNDGSPANRAVLANRLADGMMRAWQAVEKQPVTAADVGWSVRAVALPPAPHLKEEDLLAAIKSGNPRAGGILGAAMQLAWLRRCRAGVRIPITCLKVGRYARVLHLPGELFVEYQLAARRLRPDCRVAMAAYGDYGPGYIGTTAAYAEGGYETQPTSSFVAPEVEPVLMQAIRELLQD